MQTTKHCRVELEHDTIVVTPVRDLGELDCELFAVDVEGVQRILEQQRARNVVIDFGRTDFFGSDAIYLFLKLHRRVLQNKGRMAFCGLSQNEREVLSVMGLDRMWPICDTQVAAMDLVSRNTVEILVVDDSDVDRCLVGGLLTSNPDYQVRFADCGGTALAEMSRALPDLVVSDLVMPGIDGLELVAQVRTLYPLVPVILLTAHGNEAIAFEALERGAASYVPKSRQAERLTETVDRVVARLKAHRIRNRLQDCPARMECTFYLGNEPGLIRPAIDLIQHNLSAIGTGDAMEQIRIGIALEEALLNALYHGNLEISAAELSTARTVGPTGAVEQLLKERTLRSELRDRRIVVDVYITSHTARFVIRDDGAGFDPREISRSATECFEDGGNRGTMLMYTLMDEVLYNEAGNEVTLIKVP